MHQCSYNISIFAPNYVLPKNQQYVFRSKPPHTTQSVLRLLSCRIRIHSKTTLRPLLRHHRRNSRLPRRNGSPMAQIQLPLRRPIRLLSRYGLLRISTRHRTLPTITTSMGITSHPKPCSPRIHANTLFRPPFSKIQHRYPPNNRLLRSPNTLINTIHCRSIVLATKQLHRSSPLATKPLDTIHHHHHILLPTYQRNPHVFPKIQTKRLGRQRTTMVRHQPKFYFACLIQWFRHKPLYHHIHHLVTHTITPKTPPTTSTINTKSLKKTIQLLFIWAFPSRVGLYGASLTLRCKHQPMAAPTIPNAPPKTQPQHPIPQTQSPKTQPQHPIPQTPNPKTQTLHPIPQQQHPIPQHQHPKTQPQHPIPQPLHPKTHPNPTTTHILPTSRSK